MEMEKVIIIKCEPIINGQAHGIELADGRKATAWNDRIDSGILMQHYASRQPLGMEIVPYMSKLGKSGLNVNAISSGDTTLTSQHPAMNTNAPVVESNGLVQAIPGEMPTQEDFGESDITSINAKSSVKLIKNSKGINWEIKVVTGEIDLIQGLGESALAEHKRMCEVFPVEQ